MRPNPVLIAGKEREFSDVDRRQQEKDREFRGIAGDLPRAKSIYEASAAVHEADLRESGRLREELARTREEADKEKAEYEATLRIADEQTREVAGRLQERLRQTMDDLAVASYKLEAIRALDQASRDAARARRSWGVLRRLQWALLRR